HAPAPHLHSLPTRRSSDLRGHRDARPAHLPSFIRRARCTPNAPPGARGRSNAAPTEAATTTETVAPSHRRGRGANPASPAAGETDRKSTRLNSSHEWISYA